MIQTINVSLEFQDMHPHKISIEIQLHRSNNTGLRIDVWSSLLVAQTVITIHTLQFTNWRSIIEIFLGNCVDLLVTSVMMNFKNKWFDSLKSLKIGMHHLRMILEGDDTEFTYTEYIRWPFAEALLFVTGIIIQKWLRIGSIFLTGGTDGSSETQI